MSSTPFSTAARRGAVDLSALKNRPPVAPQGSAPQSGGGGPAPVLEVTDASFPQAVEATTSVAAVLVLYSQAIQESVDFIDVVTQAAARTGGRLQVLTANIDTELGIRQAFQAQSVPVVIGLVAARPVPLFAGGTTRKASNCALVIVSVAAPGLAIRLPASESRMVTAPPFALKEAAP